MTRLWAAMGVFATLSLTTLAQQPQIPPSPVRGSGETSQADKVIHAGRLIDGTSTAVRERG